MSNKTKKYLKIVRLYGVYVVFMGMMTLLGLFMGKVFNKFVSITGWDNI